MTATEFVSKKEKRCYWCDAKIHFDKYHVTKDGKYLPVLDCNNKVHNCKEKRRIWNFNRQRAAPRANKYTNREFW